MNMMASPTSIYLQCRVVERGVVVKDGSQPLQVRNLHPVSIGNSSHNLGGQFVHLN